MPHFWYPTCILSLCSGSLCVLGLSFCHSMIQLWETGPSVLQEQPECTKLLHCSLVLPTWLTSDSPGTPLSSTLLTLSWLFYQPPHRVNWVTQVSYFAEPGLYQRTFFLLMWHWCHSTPAWNTAFGLTKTAMRVTTWQTYPTKLSWFPKAQKCWNVRHLGIPVPANIRLRNTKFQGHRCCHLLTLFCFIHWNNIHIPQYINYLLWKVDLLHNEREQYDWENKKADVQTVFSKNEHIPQCSWDFLICHIRGCMFINIM